MTEPATARRCGYCGKPWDDSHDETTLYGLRIVVCPDVARYDAKSGFMIAPLQREAE